MPKDDRQGQQIKESKKRPDKSSSSNDKMSVALKASIAAAVVAIVFFVAAVVLFSEKKEPVFMANELDEQWLDMEEEKEDNYRILNNITINDIDVSELTKEEAIEKLNEEIVVDSTINSVITFVCDAGEYDLEFSSLNPWFALEKAVDEAYLLGREDSSEDRRNTLKTLKQNKVNFIIDLEYDQYALIDFITALCNEVDIKPLEPRMEKVSGNFNFIEGNIGYAVNQEKAFLDAKELFDNHSSGRIELEFAVENPKYTVEDFHSSTSLLGSFSTNFAGGTADRIQNVTNASSKINNRVILPGEIFSTNEAFGAMTLENGYRYGTQYVGGKLEQSIGGGICQVSSTLYVAALYSEIGIEERRNHSMPVGYMDWAFDATLAGDYIDLKLRNDSNYPLMIESYTSGSNIIVNIYGHEDRDPGRKIQFKNAFISSTPPPAEKVIKDPKLPAGQRVVEVNPKTGYVYELYKYVYQNGELIEKVKVNTSTYRTIQGEVRVGTG